LGLINVLVFVHQDILEASQQSVPNFIRLQSGRDVLAAQEFDGVVD
jgi:hypothetical protein